MTCLNHELGVFCWFFGYAMTAVVSVIIPTYNRAKSLARALDSVFAQKEVLFEVIVVDDGSTDDTKALIEQQYPTVCYHYQSQQGVSAARNSGVRLATSPWIAFLDSDDEWAPDKLHQQLCAAKQYPDIKIVHTNEIWIRSGKRVNPMKKHKKKGGWIFPDCLPLCAISPSSVMIHREVFQCVGLFDETLPACEDYDLWLRITSRFEVMYLDQLLTIKYGGHVDQLSQKYWGMDRFRIQALHNIIKEDVLSSEHQQLATSMLKEKITIFLAGALKRNNFTYHKTYEAILDELD